ncbi:MAG: N-acetyltransferase [Paucimonas sp.]|nr:N-acetyltransferase [Paucimonas sp.]
MNKATTPAPGDGVRPLTPGDMDALLRLIAEHCAYEGTTFTDHGQAARLEQALFGPQPRLFGALAVSRGQAAGFVTASTEYSTWNADTYLHMDCLYLQEQARGQGLGMQLLAFVHACARQQGCKLIQWQTPQDNALGQRFYRKTGASCKPKLRYFLPVEAA